MMRSRTETSGGLPLASAVVCLLYNALTVLLCTHMPDDPVDLASYIRLYSLGACIFSTVGIYGIVSKRAGLVRAYSQFLLIDAFVSVIFRMLLEEFFVETLYETNVCGSTFDDDHWSSSLRASHALVSGVRWESKFKRMFDSSENCDVALAVLHFVAVGAMILTAAAQISLAMLMQKFGRQLESCGRYELWTIHEVDEKLAEEEDYFGFAHGEKR